MTEAQACILYLDEVSWKQCHTQTIFWYTLYCCGLFEKVKVHVGQINSLAKLNLRRQQSVLSGSRYCPVPPYLVHPLRPCWSTPILGSSVHCITLLCTSLQCILVRCSAVQHSIVLGSKLSTGICEILASWWNCLFCPLHTHKRNTDSKFNTIGRLGKGSLMLLLLLLNR